jgi:plastocyanin
LSVEGSTSTQEIQTNPAKLNMFLNQHNSRPHLALISLALMAHLPSSAMTNVIFQNFSFTPQSVTIEVGDTVVWTNAGGVHTVTGDGADPFCGPDTVR